MLIPAPSAALALSSLHSLSSHYFLLPSHSLPPSPPLRRGDLAIRMGGGPRTYPGGVSKWQWKRMQAKKARQLLKARLARERQLYEMRKRTELRDAVAHLERPWDPDTSADASAVAPNLLSVAADDQLRALADRFHRPGGVDLWNDRDGPRVFASPATGAASARFFPKNAVHSVQPYALVGDGGEASAPRAWGDNAAGLLQLGLGDSGAQGVRDNATEDEAYHPGDDEPAVELRERDGTWEPVNTLDDGDDSIPGYRSSDDDSDIVPSELEDMGDVGPRHVPRAMMLRRNGRNNGMPRWDAAGTMAAGSVDDSGWSGDAFFSDPERAREGPRERRWQERSSGASTRKRAGGRRSDLNTIASSHAGQRGRIGSASFSDSEVIHGGSERKWRPRTRDNYGDGTGRANEPKWRPRTRDDNGNGVGRANEPKWRPSSRGDNGNGVGRWNAPRQDRISVEFKSNSDTARGGTEPRWGARNKFNGRENFGGRSKPKYSTTTSDGDARGRQMRLNNGDEHESSSNGDRRYRFGGGFAEDLEAPTWKPRRMNRARNNNGDGRTDSVSGRFRRGDNARRLQDSSRSTNREDGQRVNSNGGQRFRGDDYSLRPTSELHRGSWGEM